MKVKFWLSLLLLGLCAGAMAQVQVGVQIPPQETEKKPSLLKRMDTKMYKSQHGAKVDTSYIHIPEERWTLKTTTNFSWGTLGIVHLADKEGYRAALRSDPTISQGFSVAWRWLEVGFSVNPSWFIPRLKNKDQAYSISVFGNKFGLTATFRSHSSFQGSVLHLPDSTTTIIPRSNDIYDLTGDFDAYYVFRGDKFSFPAAGNMMQVQKRSAGSAILGLSIRNGYTQYYVPGTINATDVKVITNILAVGGGYAHNFVTPHHWLFHVSALANLSLLSFNQIQNNTGKYQMTESFPDWVANLQFTALHWSGRWFYGFNASVRGAVYGLQEKMEFYNAYTRGYFIVGCRL